MSPERARVLREAGDKFDREEAAAERAAGERSAIARASASLANPNPLAARLAARLLANDPNPKVRAIAAAKLTKSPAGRAGADHGPRTARGAKATSKAGVLDAGGGKRKAARSATSPTGSRWAHFANVSTETPITAAAPYPAASTPGQAAGFIMASAAKARGLKPPALVKPPAPVRHDMTTPEGVAAFVAASAAKARGSRR